MVKHLRMRHLGVSVGLLIAGALVAMVAPSARADLITFDSGDGLSGVADFTLLNPTTLEIVLQNTSWNPNPTPGEAANGILTSLAFDLPDGITIIGGSAVIGDGSRSINFDNVIEQLTEGDDVSGEWGYGNDGGTGFGNLINYMSSNTAGTSAFSDPSDNNLDGPPVLDGPQGGLVAVGWDPGGRGGIEDSITVLLDLSSALTDLSFLEKEGAKIEFGSDYLFVISPPQPNPQAEENVPEPVTCLLFGLAGTAVLWRVRKDKRLRHTEAT